MILSVTLTVPRCTSSSAPIRQEIKVCKGTLVRVALDVPPGPNGELYVRLLHLENSVIPDTVDEWIPLNQGVYTFNPTFSDWKGVYIIQLEGCSPGARYPHTIEVLMEIEEVGTVSELLNKLLKVGFRG